jgi:hypothetical protein
MCFVNCSSVINLELFCKQVFFYRWCPVKGSTQAGSIRLEWKLRTYNDTELITAMKSFIVCFLAQFTAVSYACKLFYEICRRREWSHFMR